MAVLPEVTARLGADVSGFVQAWERAAATATAAAARIRAAQAVIERKIDAGGLDQVRQGLDRAGAAAQQAQGAVGQFGTSSRSAGDSARQLGGSSDSAGVSMQRFGQMAGVARAGVSASGVAMGVLGGLLPAVAAAALAGGAALQALGVAGAVVAGGWRGISQAGDRLQASLRGLQRQLESTFRTGLSQEFRQLGQAISTLDGPLKGIARAVVDVVKEFTGWIRSAQGMSEIRTMLEGVEQFVRQLTPGAKALAQAFTGFGAAAAPALDDIGKALSSVFQNLKEVIDKGKETGQLEKAFQAGAKAIEGFGEILAGVVDILIEMAGAGGDNAAESMKKLGQALSDLAPAIGTLFQFLTRVVLILATVVEWFAKASKAVEPFFRFIQEAGHAVDKFLKNGEGFKGLGAAVATAFSMIGKAVKEGVNKAVQDVKDWWNKNTQEIKAGTAKAVQEVKQWWTRTAQDVKAGVNKIVQDVKQWWTKTTQEIKSGAAKAVQAVKDWWDKTVEDVKAGVEKAVQEIKELPQKALDALSSFVSDMKQVGKDAIDGLGEGMKQAVSNLIGTATRIAQQALNAIKSTLGIASPSRVFADEVGAQIPAGIALGIEANAHRVTDAMRRSGLMGTTTLMGGRGGALGGTSLVRGGQQALTLHVAGGSDGAVGTMIARLAQQGKLKITANAVVGGR